MSLDVMTLRHVARQLGIASEVATSWSLRRKLRRLERTFDAAADAISHADYAAARAKMPWNGGPPDPPRPPPEPETR